MIVTFVRIKQRVVLLGLVVALVVTGAAPLLGGHGADAAKQGKQRHVSAESGRAESELHATTTRRFENTETRLGFIDGVGTVATSSTIEVSGLTGAVVDVDVNLIGISHGPDHSQDMDVLLIGPEGRTALILSDVAGNTTTTGVTLVLDDQQAEQMPSNAALTNGFFQPTNVGSPDTMNLGNGPITVPSGASLGAFNGINPNGTWRLWAYDDEPNGSPPNHGGINGGWAVTITTVDDGPPATGGPTVDDGSPDGGPTVKDKNDKKGKGGKKGKSEKNGKRGKKGKK